MAFNCSGCGRHFDRQSDFIQHLNKTTSSACHAVLVAREAELRPIASGPRRPRRSPPRRKSSSHSPSPTPQASSSHCPTPTQFQGDYYGSGEEYTTNDFPFPDDDEAGVHVDVRDASVPVDEEQDGESEGEGDDLDHEAAEPVWEAPRPHVSPPSPVQTPSDLPSRQGSPMNIDEPITGNNVPPPDGPIPVPAGQDHLREPPTYTEPFGGQAGAPLPSPHPAASGYDTYSSNVKGSQTNPYAPFQSRIDWEIAKWAKLRGSGSTAFSDLLAIEGVRYIFMFNSVVTNLNLMR